MVDLTNRQKEVLGFIEGFIAEKGYSPSVREMSAHFERSINCIFCHVHALIKKGHVKQVKGKGRSLIPLSETSDPDQDEIDYGKIKDLTPLEMSGFKFISRYVRKNIYSPSYREISEHLKKTVGSSHHLVESLEKKGYLERNKGISRGIVLND